MFVRPLNIVKVDSEDSMRQMGYPDETVILTLDTNKWFIYRVIGQTFTPIEELLTDDFQLGQTITVSEDINPGDVINSDGSKSNSVTVGKRNKAIGIALDIIPSGFSGTIITSGAITISTWSWIAGNILFLNGTSLSTTSPGTGFTQKIARAISPTTIEIEIGEAILL